jgi:glucose/mannose-6-phosphate isomerase
MQPRHSIGFMIGYTMAILDRCGCTCPLEDRNRLLDSLAEYRDYLESDEGVDLVESLVDKLRDTIPAVVSNAYMQSIAVRWKTQVNENSKFVAFCGSFSEFDCDAISRWIGKGNNNLTLVTIGRINGAFEDCSRHLAIDSGCEDPVENAIRAMMLGDYISMRMAERRGVDPESVAPIKSLKKKLAMMPDFRNERSSRARRLKHVGGPSRTPSHNRAPSRLATLLAAFDQTDTAQYAENESTALALWRNLTLSIVRNQSTLAN